MCNDLILFLTTSIPLMMSQIYHDVTKESNVIIESCDVTSGSHDVINKYMMPRMDYMVSQVDHMMLSMHDMYMMSQQSSPIIGCIQLQYSLMIG